MNCPKCQADMEAVEVEGITVNRCVDCKGMWFDRLEHEKLKKVKGGSKIDIGDKKAGREQDKIKDVQCPRCNVKMVNMVDPQQTHISFEACSTCGGVYFDAGEFRDFAHYTVADIVRHLFASKRD
jgi:Zn-finger nucleic acid-binding protein